MLCFLLQHTINMDAKSVVMFVTHIIKRIVSHFTTRVKVFKQKEYVCRLLRI